MSRSISEMTHIVAVTVTYRRQELLHAAVQAMRDQTRPPDEVVVVDNGDLARRVLVDFPETTLIEAADNLGPAGGYEIGLRHALDRGADKMWLVDDDSEPDPDCLEILLKASRGADVMIPLQLKPGGLRVYPASWHGTLIDADVVRRIGYPDSGFFFSKEDTEYFSRATKLGFPRNKISSAIVVHHHSAGRIKGQSRTWRLYYEIRNHLHYYLRVQKPSPKGIYRSLKVVLGIPVMIILTEPEKARSLRLWWWGVRDFVRCRLGKTLDPGSWTHQLARASRLFSSSL